MIAVNKKASAGFTLLELLISITIFGLIAAMAYSGLNNVLLAQRITEDKAQSLHKLQSTFVIFSRDVEQTVNRSVRNNYGEKLDALKGNQIGTYLLEFTRTGWLNPNRYSDARSNMMRVAYALEEDKLVRYFWYHLDRSQDTEPYKMELMAGVKNVEFRYLDEKQEWHNSWPRDTTLLGQENQQAPDAPPRALAVELETEEFGKIERWFRIPG